MFAEKKTFFPPLYQPLLASAPRSGANIVSERLIAGSGYSQNLDIWSCYSAAENFCRLRLRIIICIVVFKKP